MEASIRAYFSACDENGEPYTVTGLTLALATSRDTLLVYEKIPEFADTVKNAKLYVEYYCEKRLHTARNPTGAIFALKNFGWTDRQTIASDADQPFNVIIRRTVEPK